jgi:hypothetical protein
MDYDSTKDTLEHIMHVRDGLGWAVQELTQRAEDHDRTKMGPEEKAIYDEYTPKLRGTTFNSPEYKEYLVEMGKALEHHYAQYRHHPEHFTRGMKDMTLIDLLEMLIDWRASTKRHADGDVMRSVEVLQERFGYSDELKEVFVNTVHWLKQQEELRAKKKTT